MAEFWQRYDAYLSGLWWSFDKDADNLAEYRRRIRRSFGNEYGKFSERIWRSFGKEYGRVSENIWRNFGKEADNLAEFWKRIWWIFGK